MIDIRTIRDSAFESIHEYMKHEVDFADYYGRVWSKGPKFRVINNNNKIHDYSFPLSTSDFEHFIVTVAFYEEGRDSIVLHFHKEGDSKIIVEYFISGEDVLCPEDKWSFDFEDDVRAIDIVEKVKKILN